MSYLLDTHTFLWFINGDKQLSVIARAAIDNPSNKKIISIASLWEIAIKINIGKLQLTMPFKELGEQIKLNGFELLPINFGHTIHLSTLDWTVDSNLLNNIAGISGSLGINLTTEKIIMTLGRHPEQKIPLPRILVVRS